MQSILNMRDKFDREINYLRVSITDRCNLHCNYCRPKEGISLKGHDDILRYEEIIKVVAVAVKMGLIKVRVTGGEPLLRRDFIDFLTALNSIEGLQDISLTTNGILLEKISKRTQHLYCISVGSKFSINLIFYNLKIRGIKQECYIFI